MSKAPSVFRSHTTRKGFVQSNDGERYCTELVMQGYKVRHLLFRKKLFFIYAYINYREIIENENKTHVNISFFCQTQIKEIKEKSLVFVYFRVDLFISIHVV